MAIAQAETSIVHKALQAELKKLDKMDEKTVRRKKYDNELSEDE